MVDELLEASAFGIFVAISLCPSSVTVILPYLAKGFLSGERRSLAFVIENDLYVIFVNSYQVDLYQIIKQHTHITNIISAIPCLSNPFRDDSLGISLEKTFSRLRYTIIFTVPSMKLYPKRGYGK